jgi:hypothetical protein
VHELSLGSAQFLGGPKAATADPYSTGLQGTPNGLLILIRVCAVETGRHSSVGW